MRSKSLKNSWKKRLEERKKKVILLNILISLNNYIFTSIFDLLVKVYNKCRISSTAMLMIRSFVINNA